MQRSFNCAVRRLKCECYTAASAIRRKQPSYRFMSVVCGLEFLLGINPNRTYVWFRSFSCGVARRKCECIHSPTCKLRNQLVQMSIFLQPTLQTLSYLLSKFFFHSKRLLVRPDSDGAQWASPLKRGRTLSWEDGALLCGGFLRGYRHSPGLTSVQAANTGKPPCLDISFELARWETHQLEPRWHHNVAKAKRPARPGRTSSGRV